MRHVPIVAATLIVISSLAAEVLWAQSGLPGKLESQLRSEDLADLAAAAKQDGDPKRGAILFHQAYLACRKCHSLDGASSPLGPSLVKPAEKLTLDQIAESILFPSKKIRKGFETVQILTEDGKTITGRILEETETQVVVREASGEQATRTIAKDAIEARKQSPQSLMPEGLVNQLSQRQQFLDLVNYLGEITSGGPNRAAALAPPPGSYATRPLPEYESRIDHAGLLSSLDRDSFRRGEAIYQRLCINCHGDHKRPGSLPTSLRFATGKFKNGSDPFSMYQTLTRGYGMMQPQMWMVPQQKYDVIHYIREAYLKSDNPTQWTEITDEYLESLPPGDTKGPAPKVSREWVTMDYGPSLIHSYEVGSGGGNIAYKGIAVRLDAGPGGVSRGRYWIVYDQDTLRLSAAWAGQGFIDWNGIMFNGRHAIHPRLVGDIHVSNPTGPGWSPTGQFDAPRVVGRDGKPYGPVPRDWAAYRGLYHYGQATILSYTVGAAEVLESPQVKVDDGHPVFLRRFSVGPRPKPITLQVAHVAGAKLTVSQLKGKQTMATFGAAVQASAKPQKANAEPSRFDGGQYLRVAKGEAFDMTEKDFTVTARIQTRKGGTIFAKTAPRTEWVRDGKALFVRGGRLVYDIGWVGAVQSRKRVDDGKPHDVALAWSHDKGVVKLYIDGRLDAEGRLAPKAVQRGQVVRIGYAAADFPRPKSAFAGRIDHVTFFQRELSAKELADNPTQHKPVASFQLKDSENPLVGNSSQKIKAETAGLDALPSAQPAAQTIDAGVWPEAPGVRWSQDKDALRLTIPAGDESLDFALWMRSRRQADDDPTDAILGLALPSQSQNLRDWTKGGAPRWPQDLKIDAAVAADEQAIAVDTLTTPASNPWLARVRPTGLDFEADSDSMIVSTWDGDVFRVTGVSDPAKGLTWRRIASGLFQPLGVKIVDGEIYITCRDQICILRDLNGDGETDFYENFNNDHQVTEHFHEFAMGLQTDAAGNFYYAKSARHAKKAIVPHHGTLLRVSKDGKRTDIVATGFRAANGVCVNPDGTFIVTDQEGHWNPKNRINWVKPGGFYGNMFGYHDVTDSSDSAMEPPLCWITNSFDRSPSELLWLDSERWGALNGTLLNFSYGYGKVYTVPHEEVDGMIQGGMCALPLPQFPTGVMRGRIHPDNGFLYVCGMFAWAGNQQKPGGVYRIRPTGKAIHAPVGLKAAKGRIEIKFSEPLAITSVQPDKVGVRTWSLKRTANYGSKHYDEKSLKVADVELQKDRRTVVIRLPDLQPTWCMEIRFQFEGADGQPASGVIHNTIHRLSP